MGRRAKNNVVHWPSKGGYGAWIGGRQVMLARGPDDAPNGPVFAAAVEKWVKLSSTFVATLPSKQPKKTKRK